MVNAMHEAYAMYMRRVHASSMCSDMTVWRPRLRPISSMCGRRGRRRLPQRGKAQHSAIHLLKSYYIGTELAPSDTLPLHREIPMFLVIKESYYDVSIICKHLPSGGLLEDAEAEGRRETMYHSSHASLIVRRRGARAGMQCG